MRAHMNWSWGDVGTNEIHLILFEKFSEKLRISDHITIFWETYMQVKNQQIEPDIEQRTGSKLRKALSRLYIVTLPI